MTTRAVPAILVFLVGCGLADTPAGPASTGGTPGQSASSPSEPVPTDCVNPPPDVTTLIAQERKAACYGSAELTVEAHAVLFQGAIDCPGVLQPAWLGCGGLMIELYALDEAAWVEPENVLAARSPNLGPALSAVIHPTYQIDLTHGLDALVTATGHFDDPEAQTCRYTSWPDDHPPSPEQSVAACRSLFVITHMDPLEVSGGGDEDGPSADGSFAAHDIAQVVTTDLVVRSAPGVGEDSVIYEWQLDAPTLLYIFDGPVAADGYDWYQAMPSSPDYLPTPYEPGWVAAGSKEGEAWIGPAEISCPSPSTESISELAAVAALACYGSTQLVLEGNFGGCAPGDPALAMAAEIWTTTCWLERFDCCPNVVPYPSGLPVRLGAGMAAVPPGIAQPSRLTGHFDDASSDSCLDVAPEGAGPFPPGWGQYICRTGFTVTEIVPLAAGQQT